MIDSFAKWARNQIIALRVHQDKVDRVIVSLVAREPEPIRMVDDPDSFKYRQFGFRLDRILAGVEPQGEIYWRTLWIRACRHAIMDSNRDRLETLIVINEIARETCKPDLENLQTDST